jgi:hypothetical protein
MSQEEDVDDQLGREINAAPSYYKSNSVIRRERIYEY